MTPLLFLVSSPPMDLGQAFEVEEVLDVAIAAFAIVLLALSLSAYRRTHLNRLLIVSAAFGLFAVEVLVRQLDVFVFAVGVETDEIITTLMEFVILVLFFLAVTRK